MSTRRRVLTLYKNLLVAQRQIFNGNSEISKAAYLKTKNTFKANKGLTNQKEIEDQIMNGNGVVYILKNNVATATKVKENQFLLNLKPTMLEK